MTADINVVEVLLYTNHSVVSMRCVGCQSCFSSYVAICLFFVVWCWFVFGEMAVSNIFVPLYLRLSFVLFNQLPHPLPAVSVVCNLFYDTGG